MNKPLVSIITLNLNGLADTLECLTSLKKTVYPNYEILVIDNGSEQNEAKLIKEKFGNFVKTFRFKKNKGFTGGNNWALTKTRGKYIVLLNNDTTVEPTWLNPLVSTMEADKKIAVSQPKIRWMKDKKYFDYAGAAGGFIDKYGYPFTRGRIFDTLEKDNGQYDDFCNIFWASGAAAIIRKEVIKEVGGLFSQNLYNYMEEIDFCWRAWNKGYRVTFVPNSVVYHKVAATARKIPFKKRFWEHRNNLFILTRNLDRHQLIKILPVRFLLELLTYISIVFDYFIKNKRHFNQLNWTPQ
jgi:GT2 family glycosyltransferase